MTGDSIYGGDRKLRVWLEEREQPFVLAVAKSEPLWAEGFRQVRADKMAATLQPADWQRLSAGEGAKGPRLYDWARLKVHGLQTPLELAYCVAFVTAQTLLKELVRVAAARWHVESCFEAAKGVFGQDQHEE